MKRDWITQSTLSVEAPRRWPGLIVAADTLSFGTQAQTELIAIDADYVYWANKAMKQLLRIKKH